jgi:hypothetical protein
MKRNIGTEAEEHVRNRCCGLGWNWGVNTVVLGHCLDSVVVLGRSCFLVQWCACSKLLWHVVMCWIYICFHRFLRQWNDTQLSCIFKEKKSRSWRLPAEDKVSNNVSIWGWWCSEMVERQDALIILACPAVLYYLLINREQFNNNKQIIDRNKSLQRKLVANVANFLICW